MFGILLKDLPVERFGLRQAPRLVVTYRQFKCLLDRLRGPGQRARW